MTLPLYLFMKEHIIGSDIDSMQISIVSDNAQGSRPPPRRRKRSMKDPSHLTTKSNSMPPAFRSTSNSRDKARTRSCRRPTRTLESLDISDHTKKDSRWESASLSSGGSSSCTASMNSSTNSSITSGSMPFDASPTLIVRKLATRSLSPMVNLPSPRLNHSSNNSGSRNGSVLSRRPTFPLNNTRPADPSSLPPVKSLRRVSPLSVDPQSTSQAMLLAAQIMGDEDASDSSVSLQDVPPAASTNKNAKRAQKPPHGAPLPSFSSSSCSSYSSTSTAMSFASDCSGSSCSTFGSPKQDRTDRTKTRYSPRQKMLNPGNMPRRATNRIRKDRTACTLKHVEEALDLCDILSPPKPRHRKRLPSPTERMDMAGTRVEGTPVVSI